jgi:hypothetical protein
MVLQGPTALHVLVLLFLLFIAYMLVYEIGYAENDRIGEQREARPKLSEGFFKKRGVRLEPDAWIWAGFVTLAAFAITPEAMRLDMLAHMQIRSAPAEDWSLAVLTAIWMAFLGLARFVFFVFNQAPLAWRVFAYVPLHLTKYFGPLLLLPIHPAGVALGLAQIVRTWSMYAIRRAGGDEHVLSSQMVRLTFFLLLSVCVFGFAGLTRDQASLLVLSFGFCVIRALPEIRKKMFGKAAGLGPVQ